MCTPPPGPDCIEHFPKIQTRHRIISAQQHSLPAGWDARWDLRSCTRAHRLCQAPSFTLVGKFGELRAIYHLLDTRGWWYCCVLEAYHSWRLLLGFCRARRQLRQMQALIPTWERREPGGTGLAAAAGRQVWIREPGLVTAPQCSPSCRALLGQ